MAVGASDQNHIRAAVPDGIVFLAPVPRRFIRIRTWPHSATRPTAVTVAAIWLHFDEAIHTLVDDPSRLLIKTLAEVALEFSSVFTGVMPGEGFSRVHALVQLYPARLNELDQVFVKIQIIDIVGRVLLYAFLHTDATAVRSAATVRHDHPLDAVFPDEIYLPLCKDFDVFIVTSEKTPIHRLPVLRRNRPVFLRSVEDFPPPFHVIIVCENFLGVRKKEDVGPPLVDGHVKPGTTLLRQLLPHIVHEKQVIIFGNRHVVPGFETVLGAFVENAAHFISGAQGLHMQHNIWNIDTHGTCVSTTATSRTNPGKW